MGYELHITRAENWAENQGNHIAAEEWLAMIDTDSELTLDGRNGPYFAVWSRSSKHEYPWFDWFEGNIYTKYPDQATLEKMLQIADKLGAAVQGDDGEVYSSAGDYTESRPLERTEISRESRMPAYERREFLWNVVMYVTVALVIIAVNLLDLW